MGVETLEQMRSEVNKFPRELRDFIAR